MLSLKNKILMTAATGLLAAGGFVATANAQGGMAPQGQQQQQQANVTNAQLQEFARAEASVRQVQQEIQQQAANAESQAEISALQQQASQQMIEAIERTNLGVQEYNQIANAIQSNPDLQEKYLQMVR